MDKKRYCPYLKILLVIEFVIVILVGIIPVVYYLGPVHFSMSILIVSPIVLLLFFFTLLSWLWFCRFLPSMTSDT
ncbi:MAG: hypothetical protein ACFFF4_18080 [Candidatus Thorarchaeota archaeon]